MKWWQFILNAIAFILACLALPFLLGGMAICLAFLKLEGICS